MLKNLRYNESVENSEGLLNILFNTLKTNESSFEIIDRTNPIIVNYENKDYLIHISRIHSWEKRPNMRRIQVKSNLKKSFSEHLTDNIIFAVLGYSEENDTFTSWNVKSIFSDYNSNKSLFTYDVYLYEAEENGISHDLSIKQKSNKLNIINNYPITFRSKYLNEFLKKFKQNKVEIDNQIFRLRNFDHLNNEQENQDFIKFIFKLENQEFVKPSNISKKNINIRKFILNNASTDIVHDINEIDEFQRLNLLDRASKLHQIAVNKIFTIFFRKGYTCYENLRSFDLLVVKSKIAFLIEVKSLSKKNFITQTRSALIQLEEYKFIHSFDFQDMGVGQISKIIIYHSNPSKFVESKKIKRFIGISENLNTDMHYLSGDEIKFCKIRKSLEI